MTTTTNDVQGVGTVASNLAPSPAEGSSSTATHLSTSLEPKIVADSEFEDRGDDKLPTSTVNTTNNAGGTKQVKKPN
ncbi:uncharacterized protein ARMOST_11986 [Armillaria ostoyae]|uniref:Uncharacterized protein n=1 Tax=Armillaria ostoyae TaxID=47428 RepID=A0A284RIN6_ARMOS|nr:uncharacterized protein ARMOST_11986 [Armillaria ostoyae]